MMETGFSRQTVGGGLRSVRGSEATHALESVSDAAHTLCPLSVLTPHSFEYPPNHSSAGS